MDAQSTLLCLPNEILIKIFPHLTEKCRTRLGAANRRLFELEKIAGYRRFEKLEVNITRSRPDYVIEFRQKSRDCVYVPISDPNTVQFFSNALTKDLVLMGHLNSEILQKLLEIFKSVTFRRLDVSITNVFALRLAHELIRGCRKIEDVKILHSYHVEQNALNTKELLLDLPLMDRFKFVAMCLPIVDDEILHHILSNSSSAFLGCEKPAVTALGLARAFEVVMANRKAILLNWR